MLLLVFLMPANVQALSGHLPFEPNFEFERIFNSTELRREANQYLNEEFGLPDYFGPANIGGRPFNRDSNIIARSLIVYGTPHGDVRAATHRFIGYTMDNESFTNVHFPHDAWGGGGLETRNWFAEPWGNPEVQAHTRTRFGKTIFGNPFNNNPDFEDSIRAGMDFRYHDLPGAITANTYNKQWHRYLHVHQPPTPRSWGKGIMFHQRPGRIWYITIPMAPLAAVEAETDKPDFAVTLTAGVSQTEPGVSYTGTVTYRLKEAKGPTEATLRITHNGFPLRTPAGEAIHETVVTFDPGQVRTFQFQFTGQETNSNLQAEIWPTEPANRPEATRDARPQDNVFDLSIPRTAALIAAGAGDDCINDGPAPVAPPNEPAPQSTSTVRYIFSHSTYGIEHLAFCANDNTREIISGDTVRGRFQFVSYQRDFYNIENLVMVDPGCGGWDGSPGCPVSGTPGDPGCPGWPPRYEWQPAGEISHRFRRDFNYTISASLSGTTITPSSGRHGSGRDSFTWRRTVGQTAQNNFTFTVTAPNGQTWTRTDACTIFLPRGIQVSPITTFSADLHRNNRQVALFRVTNLRDVGEENVTLTFTLAGGEFPDGRTTKQESFTNDPRLVLPSGPVNATKGLLRAVEFYPTADSTTLTVRALAAPLGDERSPDNTRTLTDESRRSWDVYSAIRDQDVPAFDGGPLDRTSANLPVTYHFTTSATARDFTSGRFMDHRHGEIRYNTYVWSSRTENYTERLDVTVNIDSWQGRPEGHPRRGRGAWEIGWLFDEDAHRTIRAGTGFEVNVTANYSTNFATRAPNNHAGRRMSLGAEPTGVRRVMGAFPYANYRNAISRTNNRDFVQGRTGYRHGRETELEITTGRRGDRETSWRLPLRSHTGEDGRVHSSYTHYVSRFFPDAYPDEFLAEITEYKRRNNARVEGRIDFDDRYRFTVVTGPAGVSNLLELHEDYAFVFGHIFRDIYTTRPRD